jgi:hypothetical protein
MVSASMCAVVARPINKAGHSSELSLESVVPKRFGDWAEESQRVHKVVNPQLERALENDYTKVLTRTYANPSGYRIMLSVAYIAEQRGGLKLHKPETCYSGEGFMNSVRRDTDTENVCEQRDTRGTGNLLASRRRDIRSSLARQVDGVEVPAKRSFRGWIVVPHIFHRPKPGARQPVARSLHLCTA